MFPARFFKLYQNTCIFKRYKATAVNGKLIAEKILSELKNSVDDFKTRENHVPSISVLLVGDNPASKLYVKNKVAAAKLVGIRTDVLRFPSEISENSLVRKISELNNDECIDAILLQLPLPSHINESITDLISAEKDVDGFTCTNFGKFCLGFRSFVPCTALAVQTIIKHIGENISGKKAVICGRSKHVGLPIAMILHSDLHHSGFNASTVICHRFTPPSDLNDYCRDADVVISATGVPSLIRGHMIKKGAIVIDVGISRIHDPVSSKTKLVGDVNFEEVTDVASFITPVPGGVGPVTVAMLLKNVLLAAQQRKLKTVFSTSIT